MLPTVTVVGPVTVMLLTGTGGGADTVRVKLWVSVPPVLVAVKVSA